MVIGAKICGVRTREAIEAAAGGGATAVGFMHFAASPRHIEPSDAAPLISLARDLGLKTVWVVVEPDEPLLDRLLGSARSDAVQLHGHEPPERLAAIAARGVEVWKALPVAGPADLAAAAPYLPVADALLFDARPPAGAARPGGLGLTIDWQVLAGFRTERPWYLAGGLTPDNVAEAVRASGARLVDVSSGVESAPGVKDAARIRAFLDALASV